MSIFTPFLKHKIARRLVVYILLFSSIVTLGLTLVQLYKEYNYDISLIESRFDQILETNKAVLKENIWLINYQSIDLLTQGILRDRDIVYIEIRDVNAAVLVSKGHLPESDFVPGTVLDWQETLLCCYLAGEILFCHRVDVFLKSH